MTGGAPGTAVIGPQAGGEAGGGFHVRAGSTEALRGEGACPRRPGGHAGGCEHWPWGRGG